ncbi:MAG TPA: molybdenum ABC transporter ATP-binding protein [bacterium]
MSGIQASFLTPLGTFRLAAEFVTPGRGVTALFGPSGSGKTSVLRCLAGLERAESGRLLVNDECWQDDEQGLFLPPHRRPIGYVFQEASLFAHLNVRRNLEYGWRRTPVAERQVPFDHAVELLGLSALLGRSPAHLSGGERQRVAIARALVTSPKLLLMDEPLASLDAPSKAEILPYLQRLHDQLSIPVVYVSHALEEVLALADHMLLIQQGRITAAGPLAEVLTLPQFAALRDPDLGAVLQTTVQGHDDAHYLSMLQGRSGVLRVPRLTLATGTGARVRILARDVSLALKPPEDLSIMNVLPARITSLAEHGPGQMLVRLDAQGEALLCLITQHSAARLGLQPGQTVYALVKSVALLAGEGRQRA